MAEERPAAARTRCSRSPAGRTAARASCRLTHMRASDLVADVAAAVRVGAAEVELEQRDRALPEDRVGAACSVPCFGVVDSRAACRSRARPSTCRSASCVTCLPPMFRRAMSSGVLTVKNRKNVNRLTPDQDQHAVARRGGRGSSASCVRPRRGQAGRRQRRRRAFARSRAPGSRARATQTAGQQQREQQQRRSATRPACSTRPAARAQLAGRAAVVRPCRGSGCVGLPL